MKNATLNLIFLLYFSFHLSGQTSLDLEPCGTPAIKSEWLQQYQAAPEQYYRGAGEILYVPLTVHSIGSDAGTGHMKFIYILDALCILNDDFIDSDIQFYLEGDIVMHNNSYWYNHDWDGGTEMMNTTRVEHTVNCYIVNDPAGTCGYAWWNSVALAKSCISNGDHTWAHELGHHLSLPHTFFGWEGVDYDNETVTPLSTDSGIPVETMDGENCHLASDGFCDTPPDYLSYRWGCNSGMSTVEQIDPNGVPFYSDGSFFMSYAFDNCSSRFSEEQNDAMRAYLFDVEPDLLENQNPLPELSEGTTLLEPFNDAIVPAEQVSLSWEPVENAEKYIVQVSRYPWFGNNVYDDIVYDNTLTLFDLLPEKEYYWRVKTFNEYSFCSPLTALSSFTTAASTATEDVAKEVFVIYPNLLSAGEMVNIASSALVGANVEISINSISGQLLSHQKISGNINKKFQLSAPVESGIYLITINNGMDRVCKKIIVK